MTQAQRAVILGATGAVGGQALAALLASDYFSGVTAVGRRAVEVSSPRLTQHSVELKDPDAYAGLLTGHTAAICTLGVGEPSKVTRAELWEVDVEHVMRFAAACRAQGVQRFGLMTAVGARVGARMDYLHMKGTLEARVEALGFARTSLFQPSMLLTPSNRYGVLQAVTLAVWPRLHWLMGGSLRKFRGIDVAALGRAMARDAERAEPGGVTRYTWDEVQGLLAA